MFNKILAAIDGSERASKILDATISIASNKKAHVTLINVRKGNVTMSLAYVPEDYLKEALKELEKGIARTF